MTCSNCNDEGHKVSAERKNKITYTVYTLCLCEIGQKLEKLWQEYPAWVGAPYSFFHNRSLDQGKPENVITGGM